MARQGGRGEGPERAAGGGTRRPGRGARAGLVAALLALTGPAHGVVVLSSSRGETLYSAEEAPDCSELSRLPDDQLPLNVVRIRAAVDGAAPGEVAYRWSLPTPAVGTLAADLDLGPAERTAAVRGLCAEFGNACVLTRDKLPFYNQPTILWIAPTCSGLPPKTARDFPGGIVRVRLSAKAGRRRLGKATLTLGYGRAASVTLFADGDDGIGRPAGVASDIQPFFGARVDARGQALPEVDAFEFSNGEGDSSTVDPQPCAFGNAPFDACSTNLLYQSAGRFVAGVTQTFVDGSALCDNLVVRVLSAAIVPRLAVSATPGRTTYVPGDPLRGEVGLRVTLRNASPRQGGGGILLLGDGVLTCDAEVEVGGKTDTVTTRFDLQHCSVTTGQACTTDAECRPPFCTECDSEEVCLTQSHCSETPAQLCAHDSDCRAPACALCQDDETCVRVLATPSVVVGIGESVDLVDTTVAVENVFPNVARISETWTVNTFNGGAAEDRLRYRIKGRPLPPAGP
jgi:hypothetical protein